MFLNTFNAYSSGIPPVFSDLSFTSPSRNYLSIQNCTSLEVLNSRVWEHISTRDFSMPILHFRAVFQDVWMPEYKDQCPFLDIQKSMATCWNVLKCFLTSCFHTHLGCFLKTGSFAMALQKENSQAKFQNSAEQRSISNPSCPSI